MNELTNGQPDRDETQVTSLRDKVNHGDISPKEAAMGPIINPGALNHAHSRKVRHSHGKQLPLL